MRKILSQIVNCVSYTSLCLFSSFTIHADQPSLDQQERTFYAISSLRFYLDHTNEPDTHRIHFNEEDIAELWQAAATDPSYTSLVNQAAEIYYQTQYSSQEPSGHQETKEILLSVWQDLNHQLLRTEPIHKKHLLAANQAIYPNFDNNPYINREMRKQIKPYLLPISHSLKPTLDQIFNPFRVITNEVTFAQAGFLTMFAQQSSFIRVARHAALPGYLLKVYLDSEHRQKKNKPGWQWLVMRCEGAKNIRELIKRKKLQHFCVPDKWLYPLPYHTIPAGADKNFIQPVVLVVTHMDLTSSELSAYAWKNLVTPQHLDELFCILSHGFGSCWLVYNVPYTTSGKFAWVDTEYPKRNLDYNRVKHYFSPEMQAYWDELVKKGGNI